MLTLQSFDDFVNCLFFFRGVIALAINLALTSRGVGMILPTDQTPSNL
jgi:hypothetical protein